MPDEPNRDRADRILDAAADLLVRWGSRKVTIEDIARHAGIGKGTVYLHWRTKDQLFEAVLMRASITLLEGCAAQLREDPRAVVPHRYFRATFLLTVRDPLLSAMLANDTELLGHYALTARDTRQAAAETTERTWDVWTSGGFLRTDVANLRFSVAAAASGFYLYGNVNPDYEHVTLESKADSLAHVIRSGFEPAAEPGPAVVEKAAAELREVLETYVSACRAAIYPGSTTTEAG
ncbi:TetR/AcrR family transcriptional regulator [Amycolatopsis sp. NPDC051903]|uniref:TetR/AcrR family transcriptional regulator n=1 Tax=Amycolatopsis sp. NPDC051903 TaxID=3363936 RepID=UPI003797732C